MQVLPAERKITVPFPADKVKTAINQILDTDTSKYFGQERNDLMSSYTFSVSIVMMQISRMSISLNEISPDKTEINITNSLVSGRLDTPYLNQIIDAFLRLLTRALSGEPITQESISKETSGGCASVILLLLSIGAIMIYLFQ